MNVVTVVNQKGGVGKTTTAVQLAAVLGRQGERVLLMDLDPQGHATLGLGIDSHDTASVLEAFKQTLTLPEIIRPEVAENVDLLPANIGLSAAERLLAERPYADRVLQGLLPSLAGRYEYLVVDCPPALGLLSINALRVADLLLVPVEASLFALDGLERLKETLHMLDDDDSEPLPILVVPNMFDTRTRLANRLLETLTAQDDIILSRACIRPTVRVREAIYRGMPLTLVAPKADITGDYERLAADIRIHFHRNSAADCDALAAGTFPGNAELCEVTLAFQDIQARHIQIAGDFNDWIPDKDIQTIDDAGTFTKVLHVPPGAYEYRVIIDGVWQQDPTNPNEIPNQHGGSNSLLCV